MTIRYTEKSGTLYIDALSGLSGQHGERDIQLVVDGNEDNSGRSTLLSLIVNLADPEDSNIYEKFRADVDTTIENLYKSKLQIEGKGEAEEGGYYRYNHGMR